MSMRLQKNIFHSAAVQNIFNVTLVDPTESADALQKSKAVVVD